MRNKLISNICKDLALYAIKPMINNTIDKTAPIYKPFVVSGEFANHKLSGRMNLNSQRIEMIIIRPFGKVCSYNFSNLTVNKLKKTKDSIIINLRIIGIVHFLLLDKA